jgi:probable rRNA maturation factor
MHLDLSIQRATTSSATPAQDDFERWVRTTLAPYRETAELTIRIVDEAESALLNQTYRHRSGPTNVLSFPFQAEAEISFPLLGDIVICAPVVESEAGAQHKKPHAHWAHMVVHGILHLLGYDHQEEEQALDMERVETRILGKLGYPNPYGDEHYL